MLEAQGLLPGRSHKDLRLTWNELAAKARKYRDAKNKTGGGPMPEVNEKLESVLDALVEESVDGINGGEEAGLPSSQSSKAVQMLVESMGGMAAETIQQLKTDGRCERTQREKVFRGSPP